MERAGAGRSRLHGRCLRDFDITSFLAFLTIDHAELDFIALVQGAELVAFGGDRGEVHEHVFCPLFLRGNESITFLAVEPLDTTGYHKTSLRNICIVLDRHYVLAGFDFTYFGKIRIPEHAKARGTSISPRAHGTLVSNFTRIDSSKLRMLISLI